MKTRKLKSRMQRRKELIKNKKEWYLLQEKRKNKYQKIFAYGIILFLLSGVISLFFKLI